MTGVHNLTGYTDTRPIKNNQFTVGNSSIKKTILVAYK